MKQEINSPQSQKSSINWGGWAQVVLATTFLALVFALGPRPSSSPLQLTNVHPALLAVAEAQPDTTVSIIVQKLGDGDIESLVANLGGQITKDLHIINAFAAELPAGAIAKLAQTDGVRWVSLDGQVESSRGRPPKDGGDTLPETFFLDTLNVRPVWEMGYTGEGVGIAIIDSGIYVSREFSEQPGSPHTRIMKAVNFTDSSASTSDLYGHGTHVAGIAAGHGGDSGGIYSGVAPDANLINLKIIDETGMAQESDLVAAMQWVLENKDQYNIRVVNMSLNSVTPGSYHDSPVSAAAEILWFNRVVVVVSSGNGTGNGVYDTINSSPAHDPFLIAVGAMDEKGTSRRNDDSVPTFSAWGNTYDGHLKPEIFAPGTDIISVLSQASDWDNTHSGHVVGNGNYFRLSGTSMAAPMVTGAVALLVQAEPDLTPDQVKYRLIHSASWVSGWRYLDVYATLTTPTTESANTGIEASQLLWTGDDAVTWDSVTWDSVNWASVNWASVNWASVNWASVNWASTYWEE